MLHSLFSFVVIPDDASSEFMLCSAILCELRERSRAKDAAGVTTRGVHTVTSKAIELPDSDDSGTTSASTDRVGAQRVALPWKAQQHCSRREVHPWDCAAYSAFPAGKRVAYVRGA